RGHPPRRARRGRARLPARPPPGRARNPLRRGRLALLRWGAEGDRPGQVPALPARLEEGVRAREPPRVGRGDHTGIGGRPGLRGGRAMRDTSKTFALIHTSAVLVPSFSALCARFLPGFPVFHMVDESLIKNTIAAGYLQKS